MYTKRETVLIHVALWTILAGFITGMFRDQTSPFVAVACFMLIGASSTTRSFKNGAKFSTCVIVAAVQSLAGTIALVLYMLL